MYVGLNQVPGMSPWNYGNYYLGNTTMQMMPMMLNKVHKYGQMQAMAALGNAGLLGSAPMLPNMSMNPCCQPPSFSMPMASPMMAAATPLPVAFNPLVQGMYPMASMSPVNWMTPGSFMSALSAGPMPYRPPGFDFPNNVGMVMTIPYGTPNPLFPTPNMGSTFPCCSYYNSMPSVAPPMPPPMSYYPQPAPVPQPYPVPYSVPAPIPDYQQVPVPHPVSAIAPPMVATGNQLPPVSNISPLCPLHGVMANSNAGQPPVFSSNHSMTHTHHHSSNPPLPVYNATDPSPHLIGKPITTVNFGTNTNRQPTVIHSAAKNSTYLDDNHGTFSDRFRRHLPSIPSFSRSSYSLSRSQPRSDPVLPPILYGQLISDSGWLPKSSAYSTITSMFSSKKKKRLLNATDINKPVLHSSSSRVSFTPYRRRRRTRSNSSASEYDCAICQEQRGKRRLRKHYDSSTVSSLLSSPKHSRKHQLLSNASPLSSKSHTPSSMKQNGYKSHRRHPMKIKIKSKSPSPVLSTHKSPSPASFRQSFFGNQPLKETIHETKEDGTDDDEQENVEKRSSNENESIAEKSDQYQSKISLHSIEE